MNSSQKSAAVLRLVFAVLVLTIALALLLKAAPHPATAQAGQSSQSQTAAAEKSLDINRYANEPLELVDLKIGPNSVKSAVKFKFKVPLSEESFDNVKFNEKDDWFKNVKIRLRNISGRAISGLVVHLYFKPRDARIFYGVSLTSIETRDFQQQPIKPGEEADLQVTEEIYNPIIGRLIQDGFDPNKAHVGLSVDWVYFADDTAWRRGSFMRRDPNRPSDWYGIDKEGLPPNFELVTKSQRCLEIGLSQASKRRSYS